MPRSTSQVIRVTIREGQVLVVRCRRRRRRRFNDNDNNFSR